MTTKVTAKMMTIVDGISLDQPAGFWRRIFAGICDIVLLMTAAAVLLLEIIVAIPVATHYSWGALDTSETAMALWTVLGLVWYGTSMILLPIVYYTVTEGTYGQTLGKALFGIMVVSADGRPLGYGRAFARLLTLPYALLPAGLGLLWAALPPAKRAWHDYISATRVIVSASPLSLQAAADQKEAITAPG
jgi:uncharacterized RDD family membrane protein YckC